MAESTVTTKGQVTIPQAIRRRLGIHAGDRLSFTLRDDGVVEVQPSTGDLRALREVLKPRVRGVTLEDMDRAIAEGANDR